MLRLLLPAEAGSLILFSVELGDLVFLAYGSVIVLVRLVLCSTPL